MTTRADELDALRAELRDTRAAVVAFAAAVACSVDRRLSGAVSAMALEILEASSLSAELVAAFRACVTDGAAT